ncbi:MULTISPECIES: homoserine dehydrogenase [Gemella]|uniref:homoserine dehydrogenase n=1 Tax=Gemella TaxID=1378 RepID=UPI00076839D9|nr:MULTISPECIES: homoserine dehydrogenase [Gemella]AME08972.1 homoserine dehydrogenase [Gemella sp. oral taxon 928]AXI26542.1 homoserine dehydrogenase [Gemella sp. ND 6198]
MKIAILGFGTVGSGVYDIIANSTTSELKNIEVKSVFARSRDKMPLATNDINEILNDKEISLVVECLGGLTPAYEFIKKSLEHKKHVVTANKAVAAKYLNEFIALAKKNNVKFLFEASVGGGIPWLAGLEKAGRVDKINRIYGIFNGTSNYILDNMYRNNQEFDSTLKTAQNLGYAEADPSADIDGGDVVNKIILSNALGFNIHISPEFPTYSMRYITKNDIDYLKKHDFAIKYIGEANVNDSNYETSVMLTIFSKDSQEAVVPLNNNIITLNGNFIGELKFFGQGAGKFPTGNAIVQDIIDINSNVPRKEITIKNHLVFSKKLTRKNYLLRSKVNLNHDFIESSEQYKENHYLKTKEITLEQLEQLLKLLKQDNNILVAKFH